jgi:hypothetical protein
MWAGVTRGFAGIKLSGSIKKNGDVILMVMKRIKIIMALVRSFIRK